jgi:hypothetical protein
VVDLTGAAEGASNPPSPTQAHPARPVTDTFRHHATQKATPLVNNAPVTNNTNTGDDVYVGTWVAEVSIAHPNGELIRRYNQQQARLQQIRIARATLKRYQHGSTEPGAGRQ